MVVDWEVVLAVTRLGRLCIFSRDGEARVRSVEKDGLLALNGYVSG